MAKIRNFSRKAAKTRARVQKHRLLNKWRKTYEDEVRIEMKRREHTDPSFADVEDSAANSETTVDFKDMISDWAIKHRITKTAINDLLSILIVAGFTFLPKDSRTLMKTPKVIEIIKLSKGNLWYNGLAQSLSNVFETTNVLIGSITLDFNFDGVPLFNSSTKCFWPILASIRGKIIKF